MTVEELYDAVRSYTNRPNLSNTELRLWCDMATGALSVALREHPRNLRVGTHSQPAGNAIIRLPYDLAGLIELRSNGVVWEQYPHSMYQEMKAADCAFTQNGDCLELSQAPEEATAFTLTYYRTLPAQVIGGKPNWVMDLFPDIYLYRTLQEAAIALKDTVNGPIWAQEAALRLPALVAQGWNQNIAAAPKVRSR